METKEKCAALMDMSNCWADWRAALRQSIKASHTYYKDESVQLMMNSLDQFLNTNVCASSAEEQLLQSMWDAADENERKTLATVLLKMSDTA
jgi:hypothetical protein